MSHNEENSATAKDRVAEERRGTRALIEQAAGRGAAAELVAAVRRLVMLDPKPADMAFAAGRLRGLGRSGAQQAGLRPQRVYCARSVTVEPLLPHLIVHAACGGLWWEVEKGGYGSFADEMMNPQGSLVQARPDLVLLAVDIEDIAGDLGDACSTGSASEITAAVEAAAGGIRSMIAGLRRHSSARLVVQGLTLPIHPRLGEVADANMEVGETWAVQQINQAAARACKEIGDAVFFDQDMVAARCGRARWRDERMFRMTRLAVATEFFDVYARALVRAARPLFFPARKVLCTDLDNTLWGGIVGEDGPDGIATGNTYPGNCYQEYQRLLLQLSRRGVLLAITSKNNPVDVEEAFQRRERDLLLSLDDFVSVQIGWQSKVASLQTIARTLSLGIDSFVFVDDSEVECAEVSQSLPEVLVVQVPASEPWRIAEQVASLGAFDQLTVTDDDRQRVTEYKAQSQRATLEADAGSREQFLASLGITCTIVDALDAPLSRAAQLVGKTNQFNLTTRRHSAGDIERLADQPGSQTWALRVRDRFGDAGVVGVVLAQASAGEGTRRCTVDTFALSCRVIGRGVESALLWHVAQCAIAAGAATLVGEFIPTKKNLPCADFYPDHGFTAAGESEGGGILYEFDLSKGPTELPAWIAFEDKG